MRDGCGEGAACWGGALCMAPAAKQAPGCLRRLAHCWAQAVARHSQGRVPAGWRPTSQSRRGVGVGGALHAGLTPAICSVFQHYVYAGYGTYGCQHYCYTALHSGVGWCPSRGHWGTGALGHWGWVSQCIIDALKLALLPALALRLHESGFNAAAAGALTGHGDGSTLQVRWALMRASCLVTRLGWAGPDRLRTTG
jgi:hypothetical protein